MPRKKQPPPCPEPGKYILVNSKEGPHWRRKRGSVKKAVLNESLAANAQNTGAAEAKQLIQKLDNYFDRMSPGRKIARFSGLLRKGRSSNEEKKTDYKFFEGYEVQKTCHLEALYRDQYKIRKEKDILFVEIPLDGRNVKRKDDFMTGYYFELILVHGDAAVPGAVRTESDQSIVYLFSETKPRNCELSIQLPKKRPYIAWLKIGCKERSGGGMKDSKYFNSYAMKAIATG